MFKSYIPGNSGISRDLVWDRELYCGVFEKMVGLPQKIAILRCFGDLENQLLLISINFTPKTCNPVASKNGTLLGFHVPPFKETSL